MKCERDDITRNFFRNYVTMKENQIHNFCIQFNGAWIENHLHVSSSKNHNMLSNATGCTNCSKKYAQGGFSACWIQICNQICSLTTPAIQALIKNFNRLRVYGFKSFIVASVSRCAMYSYYRTWGWRLQYDHLCNFPSYSQFRLAWLAFAELNAIPDGVFQCNQCGRQPSTVICDGICLSYPKRYSQQPAESTDTANSLTGSR